MSKSLLGQLTERLLSIKFDELPSGVIEKTKASILDSFACAIIGHDLPWSQSVVKTFRNEGSQGRNGTVWVYGHELSALDAAFCNSVMAHSIIQEDIHPQSRSHPGTVIIPASLALAENMDITGRSLIEAIVAGYEAMGRLGQATTGEFFDQRGYRPTGFFGPFGSAAAAARLLRLDRQQLTNTLALAVSFSSGINEWSKAGSWELFVHNGNASRNGILSALLAEKGMIGAESSLEGKYGFLWAFGDKKPGAVTGWTEYGEYEIEKTYFKHFPSCAFTQETIAAAKQLKQNYGFLAEEIDRVVINSYYLAKHYPGCDDPGPYQSIIHAQASNKFAVSAVFLDGDLSINHYKYYSDPRIPEISNKITIVVDPVINNMFPADKQSDLHVVLKNGQELNASVKNLNPLGINDIVSKLRKYSEGIVSNQQIDQLIDTVMNLENISNVKCILSLLNANVPGNANYTNWRERNEKKA